MSLSQTAAQRPVLTALFCAASQFLLTMVILKGGLAFAPHAFGQVKLVAFASTIILPLVLVQVFGLWRRVGFELGKMKPEPVFLASLLICGLFVSMGVHTEPGDSFQGNPLMQFANAFGEELLFRGVIFALLVRLPVWQSIFLNGLMFGSMHLLHGFMGGNWAAAFHSAWVTAIAGFMFTAVRYRTGSLWLNVLLHMVLNLCIIYSNVKFVAGPGADHVVDMLATGAELLLAVYVIVSEARGRKQAAANA